MKRHDSEFLRWFEAQYGKRPGRASVTDADLKERIAAAGIAEAILRERREYDAMQRAALTAWNAAPHIAAEQEGE